MAISKKVELKIKDDKATLSEKIILFKNDKGIDVYFKLSGLSYTFSAGINSAYVGAIIKNPLDEIIVLEGLPINSDEIKLSITSEMINDLSEIGTHIIQFYLYDGVSKDNKITIPSVNFEVKEPLA